MSRLQRNISPSVKQAKALEHFFSLRGRMAHFPSPDTWVTPKLLLHSANASTRDDRSKPPPVLLALTGHSTLLYTGIYNEGVRRVRTRFLEPDSLKTIMYHHSAVTWRRITISCAKFLDLRHFTVRPSPLPSILNPKSHDVDG